MCIRESDTLQIVKNGKLKLWKVMLHNNKVGLWAETGWERRHVDYVKYHLGVNSPKRYKTGWHCSIAIAGRFHCLFTRKEAREYVRFRLTQYAGFSDEKVKIVRVYADSKDVLEIGKDIESGIRAISVSKMEIKSLKHQR